MNDRDGCDAPQARVEESEQELASGMDIIRAGMSQSDRAVRIERIEADLTSAKQVVQTLSRELAQAKGEQPPASARRETTANLAVPRRRRLRALVYLAMAVAGAATAFWWFMLSTVRISPATRPARVSEAAVEAPSAPPSNGAKMDAAVTGCHAVHQAAVLYQNFDGSADVCPMMQNVVQARRLRSSDTLDPWGSEYRIECAHDEIRVYSNGPDRKPGTADDLRDNFTPPDLQRVKDLSK